MDNKDRDIISVIGLGYVGLPLALGLSEKYEVIAFDIKQSRIDQLNNEKDIEGEINFDKFHKTRIRFTSNKQDLERANIYIVCVPTDIDQEKKPDLAPLLLASKIIGKVLDHGDIVVYESTVYPGCTEEDCLPILEMQSGLKVNEDFTVAYSPERMVPGTEGRDYRDIIKIVAASNDEGLERVANLYKSVVAEGVYKAPSIKTAEAAKVLENTQRYINISLMNEMAMIFSKMNINIQEVIKAAKTKWNFNAYYPGLVGGHCISVDPFYLLHKANQIGTDSPFIKIGNEVNNEIPLFICDALIQLLRKNGDAPKDCKVLVMGVTFKENVSDIRNSKVFDLILALRNELNQVDVYDPKANSEKVLEEYGVVLQDELANNYHAVIVTVAHKEFLNLKESFFLNIMSVRNPILFDIKSIYPSTKNMTYWSL